MLMLLRPEDCWALGPFFVCVLICGPRGHVKEQSFHLKHLMKQMMSVTIFYGVVLFLPLPE
jgi:hypothetical protein